MGSNITGTRFQVLEWLESHVTTWAAIADPADIGLTSSQVGAIQLLTQAARADYDASVVARDNAKSTTVAWHASLDQARKVGYTLVNTIKSFAAVTSNPDVYVEADVSPVSPPSPRPAPPMPTDLATHITNDGQVELTWKNKSAAATTYLIYRRLNHAGAFTLIDTVSGDKEYTDGDIPLGTSSASYYIVAQRNGLTSPASEEATANFGVPGLVDSEEEAA